ncbi:MAG: hypothetical protein AB8E15_08680 [Bdellovibrionales bacterium]
MAIKSIFTNNVSYKLVAFLIAILIWLLILGRGHQTAEHIMLIKLNLPEGYIVKSTSADDVKIKVKGAPRLIKRFKVDNPDVDIMSIKAKTGVQRLRVPTGKLLTPLGLRLVSYQPRYIRIELEKKKIEGDTQ